MNIYRIFCTAALTACFALAAPLSPAAVEQVADIYPEPGSQTSSVEGTNIFQAEDGDLFFFATTVDAGEELWFSDGTAAGTHLVRDIVPGTGSFNVGSPTSEGAAFFNGKFYFVKDATHDELWVSDGTAAGTHRVAQADLESNRLIGGLTAANGALYFIGYNGDAVSLWKSNGTDATVVKIINDTGALYSLEPGFTAVNDKVVFAADDGVHGKEPWVTDGTALGTRMLMDIDGSATKSIDEPSFAVVNDEAFFVADGKLWKTNASTVDSVSLTDSDRSITATDPGELTAITGAVYFRATEPSTGSELWKTDGSTTVLVKETVVGQGSGSSYSHPHAFIAVGDTLYFEVTVYGGGEQLWKSDGTGAGTSEVASLGTFKNIAYATAFGGKLYFNLTSSATSGALWMSDGTAAGTHQIAAINPHAIVASDTRLFLAADDGEHGFEPWVSDGTGAGTSLIEDVGKTHTGSWPDQLTLVGNVLVFAADEPSHGNEPWISDGTGAGTHLVADVFGGTDSSDPHGFVELNNEIYFLASSGGKFELWKYDSTTGHAALVKEFGGDGGSQLVAYDGRVWFGASTAATGYELWASDGTSAGTTVFDLVPGSDSSYPGDFAVAGDNLYFKALNSGSHRQLYVSDGTLAGTTPITAFSANILNVTAAGDKVFFFLYPPMDPFATLWVSRGTTASTAAVATFDLNKLAWFSVYGGRAYYGLFTATGELIWRTYGTTAGVVKVADIDAGAVPPVPGESASTAVAGGKLYFTAWTKVGGEEPWVTDGTAAGTRQVVDIMPGAAGSSPDHFVAIGNRVAFAATDGIHGYEPWITDGTAAGTHRIGDINSGTGNSNPRTFVFLNRRLYFDAGDGVTGHELWRADINRAPRADDVSISTGFDTAYSGTLTASDPDGDPLTFSIANAPAYGNFKIMDAATGAFTYTPIDGYSGNDSFTFNADDGLAVRSATVKISVQGDTSGTDDNGSGDSGDTNTSRGGNTTAPPTASGSGGGGALGLLGSLLLLGALSRRRGRITKAI